MKRLETVILNCEKLQYVPPPTRTSLHKHTPHLQHELNSRH